MSNKASSIARTDIVIPLDGIKLPGILSIPEGSKGIVIFAHGSGSSRFSRRNNYVAGVLNESKIATLLFDLLTEPEAEDRENVFDIILLSERLIKATEWIKKNESTKNLKIGYFGASTGAAAALRAEVYGDIKVDAIVSRGGRPDMAFTVLSDVKSPTLLIVGSNDFGVIELNQYAFDRLRAEKELKLVPHATHLFEEPGALEMVADFAKEWFLKFLNGG